MFWAIAIGICWLIYNLQGYDNFNDKMVIFKWMYFITETYVILMVISVIFLTYISYKQEKQLIYKRFLYSSFYSLLVFILFLIFIFKTKLVAT